MQKKKRKRVGRDMKDREEWRMYRRWQRANCTARDVTAFVLTKGKVFPAARLLHTLAWIVCGDQNIRWNAAAQQAWKPKGAKANLNVSAVMLWHRHFKEMPTVKVALGRSVFDPQLLHPCLCVGMIVLCEWMSTLYLLVYSVYMLLQWHRCLRLSSSKWNGWCANMDTSCFSWLA